MYGNLKSLTAAAVSAAAVISASAVAAQVQTPARQPTTVSPIQVYANSVRVSYRDLDLNTDRGMSVLRARITRASYHVCDLNMQPLFQQLEQLGCVNNAKRGAFDQLAAARSRVSAPADMALILPMER